MEKKAIIIHGWGATPESDWFPFLGKELVVKGYSLEVPVMPDTDEPRIKDWVSKLDSFEMDEGTSLIGHSIGCHTILRFLEKSKTKVNHVILVAPWLRINKSSLEDEEKEIAKPWAESSINLKKVKSMAKKFVVVYSENDPFHLLEDIKILVDDLGAKELNLGRKGHINAEDGVVELPEILSFL